MGSCKQFCCGVIARDLLPMQIGGDQHSLPCILPGILIGPNSKILSARCVRLVLFLLVWLIDILIHGHEARSISVPR